MKKEEKKSKTVITIRSVKDVDDYVDDALYVHPESMKLTTVQFKEGLKDQLKNYKQFAFIKESGYVIAAIDMEGKLQVALID